MDRFEISLSAITPYPYEAGRPIAGNRWAGQRKGRPSFLAKRPAALLRQRACPWPERSASGGRQHSGRRI